MNHRKEKDRSRLRFEVDHVRSRDTSRGKRLKPLNRTVKRPPSQPKRLRELERRLKHVKQHQENKNPNSQATALALSVLNNSNHRSRATPRMIPSPHTSNSRSQQRSHRHSFKPSDRHSPWPSAEFDPRSRKMDFDVTRVRSSIDMRRGKINFDDISKRGIDRQRKSELLFKPDFDSASRRRKDNNKRSLKVVRFAPDVQVFEYPNGGTMPSQQNGGPPGPAPNPPTLKKKGYSTTPPMELLRQVTSGDLAQVADFTIHHIAYGSVKWPGKTDLRGLDLDHIVRFEGGAVYVYENENLPPQGTGLNKPAEVSLVGCWPRKMDAKHLTKYEQSLREHCAKEGMSFIDYSPDIGRWRFRVTHF